MKFLLKVVVGEIGYSIVKEKPLLGGALLGLAMGALDRATKPSDSEASAPAPDHQSDDSKKLSTK